MLISALRMVRSVVWLVWLLATIGLLGVALLPHAVAALKLDMFIVSGASMEPALPLGSAIIVGPVDPATIAVGDVITFRAENGTIVTHRVVGLTEGDPAGFATKGDASSAGDPVPVLADTLVGRVKLALPGLGMILALLGSTVGFVAAVALLVGLLLLTKFIDELLATLRRTSQRGAVVTEPAR